MSKKRKSDPRLAVLTAKSSAYWAKLAAIISITGYLAWLSFIHAVANISWQQNPDMALSFVPDHPLALSRKADELFSENQDARTLAKVEAMAKQSLKGGALNPVAIRLLGYVADVRGDQTKARELMLLSQKVSRRDLGTQLWLIEDAVARGDKKQALQHYDIALRTKPSSFSILFPTLVGALDDPEVRSGLAPYVKANPVWLPSFLNEAINNSENPVNVADVLLKAGALPDSEDYRSWSNQLLAKLALKSQFSAYRQYYLSLTGSKAATLRSVGLSRLTVNLPHSSAGWQLVDNADIGGTFSSFDKSGKGKLLGFAGSGERGALMHKYLFLEPGNYKFSAFYDAPDAAPDAEIRWEMQCLSAKGNVAKWFTADPVRKGRSAAAVDFDLGADCRNQMLILQVAGGSGQTGMEFTLRSVNIKPR
jgi:hypothetical protein